MLCCISLYSDCGGSNLTSFWFLVNLDLVFGYFSFGVLGISWTAISVCYLGYCSLLLLSAVGILRFCNLLVLVWVCILI